MASTRHRATRPNPSRPSPEDPARTWSPTIQRDVDRTGSLGPRRLTTGKKPAVPIPEDDEGTIVVLSPRIIRGTRICERVCVHASTLAGLRSFLLPLARGGRAIKRLRILRTAPRVSPSGLLHKTRRDATRTERIARLFRRSKAFQRSLDSINSVWLNFRCYRRAKVISIRTTRKSTYKDI